MKKIPLGWLVAIGSMAAVSASIAIGAGSVESAIKARHDHYHELGDAFKMIRDEVRASSPNWDRIKPAAQAVKEASVDQSKWFPAGSGPESGFKTRSKAEIWSDPEGFEAAQLAFAREAPKLVLLAQAADAEGLTAQFKSVGKTCGGCHDRFRTPEKD
ncbi:MAG: cytochrome c [Steroidobacteraceae bacterium]